jgi:hypothetical protein
MATTPSDTTDSSRSVLVATWHSLLELPCDLAAVSLWRSLVRLPAALAFSLAICLLATIPVAWLVLFAGGNWLAWTCLVTALMCQLAAGLVWGVQRTLDRGAKDALVVLEDRVPEVTDQMLAPLIRMGDGRAPQVALADVRACFEQAPQQLASPDCQSRARRWISRLASHVAHWWLRAQLVLIDRALAAFEQRGETHLSLDSLKNVVRSEAVERGRAVALTNLWQFELAVAAIVFLLLAVPLGLAVLLA